MLQSWAPPKKYAPFGPGSGAVFDAGAEYVSNLSRLSWEKNKPPEVDADAEPAVDVVEGLRIPRQLEGVNAVNF
eukprot:1037527-Prorocentrum_lima.AAC.1